MKNLLYDPTVTKSSGDAFQQSTARVAKRIKQPVARKQMLFEHITVTPSSFSMFIVLKHEKFRRFQIGLMVQYYKIHFLQSNDSKPSMAGRSEQLNVHFGNIRHVKYLWTSSSTCLMSLSLYILYVWHMSCLHAKKRPLLLDINNWKIKPVLW